ncbi:MAG TPA: hypothetical protein VHF88_02345 [Thermoleophilaceae bacterium]|nr:hypothetical protein [Thermoleophilaceae bacterium]
MPLIHTDFERTATEPSEPPAKKRFCSRCGEPAVDPPAGSEPPVLEQRVCGVCGMGILLRCNPDSLPGAGSAFLITSHALEVAAVSEAAEPIFAPEEKLLGANLMDLLTSTIGDRRLAKTVSRAALRVHEAVTVPARLAGPKADEIGTMAARISTCGPPRAALIAVEQTHFGRR